LSSDIRILCETLGYLACFDLRVLFACVSLYPGFDKAGINNLSFLCFEAFSVKLVVKIIEEGLR